MMTTNSLYNLLLSPIAQAQPGPPPGAGMGQLVFIVLIFAAMWFLLIAPQRKKQKQHEKMVSALQKGDQVITSGGIYGEITQVKEDRVTLQVSDTTKIEVVKQYIQQKQN
ncbi:MAG: preprotein translocase subunit YajC [Verrucomicrobiota bacterium]